MKIKEKTLRKKLIVAILVLALVAATGGVLAYYTKVQAIDNELILKGSGLVLGELFRRDDKWLPGETKTKEVYFANHGDTKQVIRFKIDECWYDQDNKEWTWEDSNITSPAILNYTSAITGSNAQWQKIGEWYYYRQVLAVNAETAKVLSSVTFRDTLANGITSIDDFAAKTCRLTVNLQGLPAASDQTATEWNVKYTKDSSTGVLSWEAN